MTRATSGKAFQAVLTNISSSVTSNRVSDSRDLKCLNFRTGILVYQKLPDIGLPEVLFCHFWADLIWRPVTALFYYPITPSSGFHWLLMLYFMYNYSRGIESGLFDGRPADYLFMLIFNWIVCTIICLAAGVFFLLEPMVLSVLYVWCQMNRDQIVQFWFGTQFKAMYLPWILVGFNMILRGGGMNELIGILVGHAYYFLMFKYPQDFGGRAFLRTPQILYNWFPNRTNVVRGFGQAPSYRRTDVGDDRAGRHNWGQGRLLGGPD
ncbi:putative derlin-1 [Onchocerca flexuosa]|uniref:Derlin n=1 Tax=Onchocerca flexuosa TaxID=387005 RepID=A0A238C4Z6_9BILA|nr:putative derlin-1 [Onchocerca flexuosa]